MGFIIGLIIGLVVGVAATCWAANKYGVIKFTKTP